jgi:hypothetical protein
MGLRQAGEDDKACRLLPLFVMAIMFRYFFTAADK